jgi:hypothetical protein
MWLLSGMMFSWLTEKGILAMDPAREAKTPKLSRNEGKRPAPLAEEIQKLIIMPQFLRDWDSLNIHPQDSFPYVTLLPQRFGDSVNYVDMDNFGRGKAVASLFRSLGVRKVALINAHRLSWPCWRVPGRRPPEMLEKPLLTLAFARIFLFDP